MRKAFLNLFLPLVTAHVSLTFPPARFPPLDFLDTSRTMGPCGVPKRRNPFYTELVVGEQYNITWRMQYPHQGGFKFSLLDSEGNEVEKLAPMNGIEFTGTNDQTTESEFIRFTKPCQQCTILMERQALEWGKSYKFRSCSDVNILQTIPDEMKCSGHGELKSDGCACEKGWTGNICQYQTHCDADSDCLNGGKCVFQSGTLVQKTCYCAYGYFGRNCAQSHSGADDTCFAYQSRDSARYSELGMFDPTCYNVEVLKNGDRVYSRKVKNDIEIILDFSSTSWVALGWRPEGLDPSCRLFPDLEGVRSRRAAIMDMPPLTTVFQPSFPISKEESEVGESSRDLPPPPSHVEQGGPPPLMPENNGFLDSALRAPLHSMDCIDMVMGSVVEGRSRIWDMYSRDRSTPLEDEWFDGENSLVAAVGVEMDGRTIVMFRRWIQEIEPTDHPLGPGRMFTVWAKGQQQGAYQHITKSALEMNHTNGNFYADDVFKYHGSVNRGVHPIDFSSPVKRAKPSEVAFGVNTVTGSSVPEPEPTPKEQLEPRKEVHNSSTTKRLPHTTPIPEPEPKAHAPEHRVVENSHSGSEESDSEMTNTVSPLSYSLCVISYFLFHYLDIL